MEEDSTANPGLSDLFLDFLMKESDQYEIADQLQLVPEDHDPAVPTHMILGRSLEAEASQLSHAPLELLCFEKDSTAIYTSPTTTTLTDVIHQHNCPTVCIVMRRPGCPFCREDSLELSRMLLRQEYPMHLMGIVKDYSDTKGMREMVTQFFAHPIYRDVGRATYRGLGNRPIALHEFLNLPIGLRRTDKRNIDWNWNGWLDTIQGGVLIFDATGTLRYAYRESYADQLVIENIQAAVDAVRRQTKEEIA